MFPGDPLFRKSLKGSFETSNRRVKPSLGLTWSHCVNKRFFISKEGEKRVVRMEFSSHDDNEEKEFQIKDCGVVVYN